MTYHWWYYQDVHAPTLVHEVNYAAVWAVDPGPSDSIWIVPGTLDPRLD